MVIRKLYDEMIIMKVCGRKNVDLVIRNIISEFEIHIESTPMTINYVVQSDFVKFVFPNILIPNEFQNEFSLFGLPVLYHLQIDTLII